MPEVDLKKKPRKGRKPLHFEDVDVLERQENHRGNPSTKGNLTQVLHETKPTTALAAGSSARIRTLLRKVGLRARALSGNFLILNGFLVDSRSSPKNTREKPGLKKRPQNYVGKKLV